MSRRHESKVALVTGTGPNIGQEIARLLASEGATVICNDIDASKAEEVTKSIKSDGGTAHAMPCDITDAAGIDAMVGEILDRFGRIHILVNNAGATSATSLLDTSLDDWSRVLSVILTGTFNVSRRVVRAMIDGDVRGAIVNVASTSGHLGRANAIAYCTAKGGILNMTRAMAVDLAPRGIRVNSVSPTLTGVSVDGSQASDSRPIAQIPMGRSGNPREQAQAVSFLASDEASYVTGEDLRVDGGSLATWGWGTSLHAVHQHQTA